MAAAVARPTMPQRGSTGNAVKKTGSFRGFMSKSFAAATGQSSRKLMLGSNNNKKNMLTDGLGGLDDESRNSISSRNSLSAHGTHHANGKKKVRFATEGRSSKRIKAQVIPFPKVDNNEDVWWTEDEMFAIVEHAKQTVDDYMQHCERYLKVLDKVIQRCGSTPFHEPTVSFDMKVIKKFADAKARGLEHHVCPDIVRERQKVIKNLTITQMTLSKRKPAEREKILADRYATLSHGSKLWAKAMADGDAMVAAELKNKDV